MWANHQYFLDAVLPVAEEVGVRMALHPDDPPVDVPLGGGHQRCDRSRPGHKGRQRTATRFRMNGRPLPGQSPPGITAPYHERIHARLLRSATEAATRRR